ncbi:MAG: DUF1194 domain-containing protein [Alphaproteobacteria bacterium]
MMRLNKMELRALFSTFIWFSLSTIASAQKLEVDLQLALGSDVSRSVDQEEATLQRQGYIRAFNHPTVIGAIKRGPLGRIAVTYFEWGGEQNIKTIVGWTLINDAKSARNFAKRLSLEAPISARRTGISGAINFALIQITTNKFSSTRKVIDLSGDGANNSGILVNLARDRAIKKGFTINGLPIVNQRSSSSGWQQIQNLDLYYRDCVIGGPGAFLIVAKDYQDFGRAIMRKLILEIADIRPTKTKFIYANFISRNAPPCNIGEIRRRQRWGDWDDDDWTPMLQSPSRIRKP